MDRRLRSPARRPAAPRADMRQQRGGGSPHRFLRPGALARLRDSRIIARSLRSAASRALLPASPPPRSPAPAAASDGGGGVPCFLGAGAARGMMRYPLRKKLAAARSVVFLPPPPPPQPQAEAAEAFLNAFAAAPSVDLVAAR